MRRKLGVRVMTIREATALVLLYRACLRATTVDQLRNAARMAVEHVPDLKEHNVFPNFPFKSHRTLEQMSRLP
jgi:hypothetical protein